MKTGPTQARAPMTYAHPPIELVGWPYDGTTQARRRAAQQLPLLGFRRAGQMRVVYELGGIHKLDQTARPISIHP